MYLCLIITIDRERSTLLVTVNTFCACYTHAVNVGKLSYSHYPLRYDGLHLPHANHKFCEVNAKYQLHKLLRAISYPLYAKERVFLIKEEDTAIEVKILNMSPHQFSMFVKMTFVDSYRVDCNLVNCINNCNR